MKISNILYKILKNIVKSIVPNSKWQQWRDNYKLSKACQYPLIKHPENYFDCLYQIKDISWETMYAPAVFGRAKERTYICSSPRQDIWLIPNTIVCQDSDIVRCEKGVFWDKFNEEDFITRAKPWDANVLKYTSESVYVIPNEEQEYISGVTLSMIGVFAQVWSHFVFQFLCKLYYAGKAGLLDSNVTILMNDYSDENILEIFENCRCKYPKIKLKKCRKGVDYICEKLICIPSLSTNNNETYFSLDFGFVIPKNVIETLMQKLVKPYTDKIKDKESKYSKLFIDRGTGRILSNRSEVVNYFKSLGFYVVEGANLSLEEKALLFYHATEIVGMHCSAWQNLIFCNNVKCLEMSNYRYVGETCFYTMARSKVKKWINVAGQDENASLLSNYYIPLDKIKRAYKELLNDE